VPLSAAPGGVRLDRLGTLLSLAAVAALVLLPFVVFKANRIVPGDPRGFFQALPGLLAGACALALAGTAAVAVSGVHRHFGSLREGVPDILAFVRSKGSAAVE